MSMNDMLAADLSGVFLTDFALSVTATTWGCKVSAIFDRDYVDFGDVSAVSPYLLMQSVDVPGSATTGDLFTVEGVAYKLADIQYAEPGVKRIVLAIA